MKMIPLKNNVSELFLKFLMNIIITPYTLAQTLSRTGSSTKVFWMTFTRYNSNYEPETDFIMINVYHTSAWLSSCSWQYSSSCYSSQWTGPTSLVGSSTSSSLARWLWWGRRSGLISLCPATPSWTSCSVSSSTPAWPSSWSTPPGPWRERGGRGSSTTRASQNDSGWKLHQIKYFLTFLTKYKYYNNDSEKKIYFSIFFLTVQVIQTMSIFPFTE